MAAQREWYEKDYYKVLGVVSTASDKEITRAYRKLAKQYHPDTNPGSEDRFKEISAAYDVLGDADKRKEYDEVRRLGPLAGGFGAPGPGGAGAPGGFRTADMGDLSDLFGGLFGNRGGRTAKRTSSRDAPGETRDTTNRHCRPLPAPARLSAVSAWASCARSELTSIGSCSHTRMSSLRS